MRRYAALAAALAPLLAAAGGLAPVQAAGTSPAGLRRLSTPDLLVIAEQALAQATAAVERAPGWVGSAHSGHRALAQGLDDMRVRVRKVRAGWAGRDPGLPGTLRRGSVTLAGLRVAWSRSGLTSATAARRLQAVAAAYDILRARHGPEAARLARGGDLTAAEAAQLRRLQAARVGLPAALGPLAARAAASGDRALATELDRLAELSRRLAQAEPSLDTLLAAVWLGDQLAGEWAALVPHMAGGADLSTARDAVEDVLGESEVGFVFLADLGDEAEGEAAPGASPAPAAVGIAEDTRVGEGVEVAVLGQPKAPLEDDAEAPEAAEEAAQAWPEWEGEWGPERELARPSFGMIRHPLLHEPAEGTDGAAEDDAAEADGEGAEDAAGGGTEDGSPLAEEAPIDCVRVAWDGAVAAAGEEAPASDGFEVTTESGEVLVVEIGADGTFSTRPKDPPTPEPEAEAPQPSPPSL